MRLADFIEQNAIKIVDEAEVFAETQVPAGVQLNSVALRDDIPVILKAIVLDLRTAQSGAEQHEKSQGLAPSVLLESAASRHGRVRAKDGFEVNQMVAEFRALRASVLRLWAADKTLREGGIEDIVRFNEAIDQAVAESLVDFTKEVESWRSMFLGVLGHDLRGPLTAIVLTSDVLAERTADTAHSVLAERILISGKRMAKLLDSLLDYNKSQLGIGMRIDVTTCNLEEALRQEVDLLGVALPESNIVFNAEGSARGQYDASRIREALHNLVTNAAKYGEPDSDIHVSLDGRPEGAHLSVSNLGAPLSPESLNTMFEPMRRGPVAATQGEEASLGLGLFVVREVANAHGGHVTVDSAEGKTQFTLWLPNKS